MKELILGGVRSGKSALATQRALNSAKQVVLIATATAEDEEMADRIARHQADRPDSWMLVEEPVELAAAIKKHVGENTCVLVDCLTLWLSNLLLKEDESLLRQQLAAVYEILSVAGKKHDIIFVSNEVGLGIVPMGELTRRFCDEAGRLHQQLAQHCERVTLVIAGLEQTLKG